MVMAYIDDIVIATETVEDHMVRLREVFECLRKAGFKMRVAKCDFMKSEIKYLGRVVSAEGVKPDPKAVVKLRDWEIPRNKTEMQSFLGFANYYREFIPWRAKLVAPLHAVTGLNATFAWGPEQQTAFNEIKKALIEATALAQPDSEGEFVLDTDASAVAISGILHQWQGPPGERRLRPIVYGSKKLTTTQAKYGAPKLEMFAAYYFIVKNHSYLCPRKFTLRVGGQPSLVLVENLLHGSSANRPMDYDPGEVSLLRGTPPKNSTSKRRWLEQTNQRVPMPRETACTAASRGRTLEFPFS